MVEDFVGRHPNARAYASLGQLRYLSCIAHVDGVLGNSSSGLLEVPVFKKGTINIGDRQRGRLQASSVINCQANRTAITAALQRLYSDDFQSSLRTVSNPYGQGGASEKIIAALRKSDFSGLTKKQFHNLERAAFSDRTNESIS
jgi:GDP/UDP-N,N'-diacetylbacillosamine 2-epimerase (hydrolysing)